MHARFRGVHPQRSGSRSFRILLSLARLTRRCCFGPQELLKRTKAEKKRLQQDEARQLQQCYCDAILKSPDRCFEFVASLDKASSAEKVRPQFQSLQACKVLHRESSLRNCIQAFKQTDRVVVLASADGQRRNLRAGAQRH